MDGFLLVGAPGEARNPCSLVLRYTRDRIYRRIVYLYNHFSVSMYSLVSAEGQLIHGCLFLVERRFKNRQKGHWFDSDTPSAAEESDTICVIGVTELLLKVPIRVKIVLGAALARYFGFVICDLVLFSSSCLFFLPHMNCYCTYVALLPSIYCTVNYLVCPGWHGT